MRHIKYSGNAAYTDNFSGSGKTWLYNAVVTGATLRVLMIGA